VLTLVDLTLDPLVEQDLGVFSGRRAGNADELQMNRRVPPRRSAPTISRWNSGAERYPLTTL